MLSDTDDCYCVLLYAEAHDSWEWSRGGAAAATAAGTSGSVGSSSSAETPTADAVAGQLAGLHLQGDNSSTGAVQPAAAGGTPLVFSGFVSHEQLVGALAPKLRGGLLGGGGWAQRTSRVMMRGPGAGPLGPAMLGFQ